MYDDVLLPTDGSAGTEAAVEHAVNAAAGAQLHLLSVVDRRIYLAADEDEQEGLLDDLRADAEAALEAAAGLVPDDADVTVETHLVEGVPYREIVDAVDDLGADLVVMGSHGHRGREKRVNLGSTTERVVKEGEFPLLIVDIGE